MLLCQDMAERFNGKAPFARSSHESTRRGISAVPSQDYLKQLQQSRNSREQLLSALRQKTFEKTVPSTPTSLGNGDLPIFKYKSDLVSTVDAHKAMILEGATGSGKSTQLPQYLYEAGYQVFILESRRIMADGLGERIQSELTDKLGDAAANLVGIVHGERHDRHSRNGITSMTPNTFIRMAPDIAKQYPDGKVAIIPDEIHEDDPHTEMAVGIAGMAVRDHENWRLIGASATINPDSIKKPLGRITNQVNPLEVEVPVFKVEGRPHDVEIKEAPGMNPAEAYLAYGTEHLVSILSTRGKAQIDAITSVVKDGLEKIKKGGSNDYIFRELSSKTSTFQRKAISDLAAEMPEGKHLVIVASPAARSGITIPNATFAATDGMINREIRDKDGYWGLKAQYMSQAELIQILGRVGRDVPGGIGYICEPMPRDMRPRRLEQHKELYPFTPMLDREEYPIPAIYNTNISGMVLEAAAIGVDFSELNGYILHEVNDATIQNATSRLTKTFGALNPDGSITHVGKTMNKFPVASELSRGIAEALIQGRPKQYMAWVALTAAAVDVGGLPDFRNNSGNEWKKMLRSGADDDFIAQLDIMLDLLRAEKENETLREKYWYVRAHDLDAKRVEDAQKSAGKILRRLGIDLHTLDPENTPSYKEIALLREDFTAGMFDQVYRDAGMQGKERAFTHIRDDQSVRFRTISNRSITEPTKGMIVAGIGQHYEDTSKGTVEVKNVITMTLNVEPSVVGRYALQNHLVEYREMRNTARINGAQVVEREQIAFGSLTFDTREVSKSQDAIPIESQRALVHYSLQNPGPAQLALRSTADELAEYRRILPAEEIEKYRKQEAPVDVTKTEIEQLLRHYAARTRNVQELDALLGEHSYQKNIAVDRYYDDRARLEMLARSPATILVGGVETEIRYDNGKPYITQRLTKDQLNAVKGPIHLEDGREVLHQVKKEGGRGTRRVSFGENLEVE